jgi:uncharacterized protein (TIGR02271 family)
VVEEELQAEKRLARQGRVRVHTDVVEEEQTLNVPVREEDVHVQRRPVDETYGEGDVPADAFQEETIDIPVYGEEVDVSKQAVVREVVDINKTARQRTQRVSDTVRRQDVRVEGDETIHKTKGRRAGDEPLNDDTVDGPRDERDVAPLQANPDS